MLHGVVAWKLDKRKYGIRNLAWTLRTSRHGGSIWMWNREQAVPFKKYSAWKVINKT
jgi:hypothetical protein